jgi:ABC-2 type transport system permease protein
MRFLAVTVQEMKAMLRERSFLLMILLEMLLVSSSGLLSVGYVILTSPEASNTLSQLNTLIYVGIVSDTRQPLADAFGGAKVHYTFYNSFAVAHEDFKEGLIDAIVMGDLTSDASPSVLSVYMPSNSPKTPLTKLALKKAFLSLEENLRQFRVETYTPQVELMSYRLMNYNPRSRYVEIYFIFTLPILLFLPCVISGSLAIDSLTEDMESKRMLNLVAAPLTSNQIILGKALASLIISLFQSAVWLLVLSLTFVSPENHIPLLIICGLYAAIFTNVGTILALHLRRMRPSQVIYTFVSMSAISLFSPFANISPILLALSPSYILARTAMGTPITAFAWQLLFLTTLALGTTWLAAKSSKKINEL